MRQIISVREHVEGMAEIPVFPVAVPAPFRIGGRIVVAAVLAEGTGRKMFAGRSGMGNNRSAITGHGKGVRNISPRRIEERTARREKISWRAASGFSAAGEVFRMRSTVRREEKAEESYSASFPSITIAHAGFLLVLPGGSKKVLE